MREQTLTFVVEGEPKPKGRPRFSRVKGRVITYTDKKTREFEKRVQLAAIQALAKWRAEFGKWSREGEFEVRGFFHRSDNRRPVVDNLMKSVMDGIEGVFFENDRQVAVLHSSRLNKQERPRAVVTVGSI
jgi:crossover junction endodeoxyribonuclease RusA